MTRRMESPPTYSARSSEAFLLSDDSGLLLTSGHSGSLSSTSSCLVPMEFQESDLEDNNLSESSLDDGMCSENFNTLKKGPNGCCWTDFPSTTNCNPKHHSTIDPIEPPPEFQDSRPTSPKWDDLKVYEKFASEFVHSLIEEALSLSSKATWSIECSEMCHPSKKQTKNHNFSSRHGPRLCWTPELLSYNNNSPCPSRSSLSSSRLSSSHNSLSVTGTNKVDDSSFITSAMSHDILTEISDLYNVPFDSDIYALPIDMVQPATRTRHRRQPQPRHHRKRRRHNQELLSEGLASSSMRITATAATTNSVSEGGEGNNKRHSVPGPSANRRIECNTTEPIHMTLQEVRQYLHNLYSGTNNEDSKNRNTENNNNNINNNHKKHKKNTFSISMKNKKTKETCENKSETNNNKKSFSSHLKQTLCNLFRIRKVCSSNDVVIVEDVETKAPFLTRALPPLPSNEAKETTPGVETTTTANQEEQEPEPIPTSPSQQQAEGEEEPSTMDFASSIEKVKDYGWYWGPISSEAAERILSNEPDGSFIVRDSSDDHYIFSLTFKLNGCIRHVRIEHDQGNFSFGSCTKFKSHTIVEFIENAVEHSRSGRYLFFLHRRPVLGPMRVQLLHPVSRFKQVQSLQHMCRFVILKLVRRDLIPSLPLPRRLLDYLSTPHYYSEQLGDELSSTAAATTTNLTSSATSTPSNLFSFVTFMPPDYADS